MTERGARFALVGDPVSHSVSPAIHRAGFEALGVEASYEAVAVPTGSEVETVLRKLARSGGGNVTIPHKEAAAVAVDRPTAAVRATGACNCFWGTEGGGLAGDNTDVEGFVGAVVALLPSRGLSELDVLLLGAGGAARAVLHACLTEGAREVDVLNRTRSRARRMAREVAGEDAGSDRPRRGGVRVLEGRDELERSYDLVVNATSLGLEPVHPLPLPLDDLEVAAACDLVYRAEGTEWVRHARGLGIPARDGLEMLVRQAAASEERWFGETPPLEVLRKAARRALERAG